VNPLAAERLTAVRSTHVVLPDGVAPDTIRIERGTIAEVARYDVAARGGLFDAGDLIVSPGIVDTHVHVNEPGRSDWEGFETATRAAAAGGVTTIVDMPLNSIPATTNAAALEAKREAARGRCPVDVAFWGGVVPGNARELDSLVDAGVRGFKCFLAPSGVEEFPAVDEGDLRQALPIIARRLVPLLVHAELPHYLVEPPVAPATDPISRSYSTYLPTRPPRAEVEAVRLMVRLASEFRAHVHIVHVASADAADEIAQAKAAGVPITAETCPHYLSFAAEEIADGAAEFKCAPPIREGAHRAALWDALAAGSLDLVATDHSPAPPALKCRGDFLRAWGGIASLELSLAAVWTAGLDFLAPPLRAGRAPGVQPDDLARWMSGAPARLAGLADRKGRLAPRCDADFCIWDPAATVVVDPMRLQQRHKLTPYSGRRLRGRVLTTIVRGTVVWADGAITGEPIGLCL